MNKFKHRVYGHEATNGKSICTSVGKKKKIANWALVSVYAYKVKNQYESTLLPFL